MTLNHEPRENNTPERYKSGWGRDIFRSGNYIQYFNPDTPDNPFYRIYQEKKQDTLQILGGLKDIERILDVGGGPGRISRALVKQGRQVVLLDISCDVLQLAASSEGAVEKPMLVSADAHSLPFPNDAFDCVVSLDLLCHLEAPERALREFHRVLRSRGILVLDNTNGNPLWTLFYPRYLGRNPLNWVRIMRFHGIYPGWEKIVRHYLNKTFAALLHDNGFETIHSINYGPLLCPKWHLRVCAKIE
jgi:ubiquinone/menaquinone biosynthesis C-methylase UbiE